MVAVEVLMSYPVITDAQGVRRFRANPIVCFLLDAGPFTMNTLATMDFSDADRAEFAQLIGYSVDGWYDLSYVQRLKAAQVDEET